MNKPHTAHINVDIFLDQFVVFYQLWVSSSSCKDFRVLSQIVSEQINLKNAKKREIIRASKDT